MCGVMSGSGFGGLLVWYPCMYGDGGCESLSGSGGNAKSCREDKMIVREVVGGVVTAGAVQIITGPGVVLML